MKEVDNKNRIYRIIFKRLIDFTFSLLAIIVLSPIFLIVAILVRINIGNPILYKPRRPGMNEEIYTMYKFRSMTNEKDNQGEFLPDSVRLTRFGKILRKSSLDELPELFNILKGEMSFVGPRPLSVKYLPYYNDKERIRHTVRPGLTGLAQINGRNKTTWEDRFSYDIQYVKKMSLLNDIKIFFKTFLIVFKKNDVVTRGTGKVEDFHNYRMKQNKKSGQL